jgi:DNA repair protein RecO (recombination protein O)
MLTKDQAVCIRTVDYSETSQVVTLFARLTGKFSAIAKGSKRPKSAFDGPIEVLSVGEIVVAGANRDKLATLTEFSPQPGRGALRRNLFALHGALFAAELLNHFTDEYDPHPLLYTHALQLLKTLDAVQSLERRDVVARLILFQLVLLREVGLYPVLDRCANCKRAYSSSWRQGFFSSTANGLVCRDCEMSFPDKLGLSGPAAACLADTKKLAHTSDRTLSEIERILIHHLTETLGKRPKMARHVQRQLM